MHLHALLNAILHDGHITCNDSRYACIACRIDYVMHSRNVAIIDDRVHGQIGLHAHLLARLRNFVQVVDGKMVSRMAAHVQLSDTEIDAVGPCLDGCRQ